MIDTNRFFEMLNHLGTGERAALKRCVGQRLAEADGSAVTAFYRCLPYGTDSRQEEKWFAVACFRCLWDAGENSGRPIEAVVAQLIRSGDLSDSMGHRIESLLDTPWDGDGYMLTKLSRIVRLLRQKGAGMIDFPTMLEDLLYWNSDSQSVQRKWARSIFAPDFNDTDK